MLTGVEKDLDATPADQSYYWPAAQCQYEEDFNTRCEEAGWPSRLEISNCPELIKLAIQSQSTWSPLWDWYEQEQEVVHQDACDEQQAWLQQAQDAWHEQQAWQHQVHDQPAKQWRVKHAQPAQKWRPKAQPAQAEEAWPEVQEAAQAEEAWPEEQEAAQAEEEWSEETVGGCYSLDAGEQETVPQEAEQEQEQEQEAPEPEQEAELDAVADDGGEDDNAVEDDDGGQDDSDNDADDCEDDDYDD